MNGLTRESECASTLELSAFLLCGCMQSRVEESRELHTKIRKDEAVVILAKPQVEGASAEDDFMHCVAGGLAGRGRIATRTDEQFTDALFPWFEPGTAPVRPEALASLLTRPGVAEKVAASGVRYVVWLDGGTRRTDGGGALVPLPLIARVQGTACDRMADQLRTFFTGSDDTEPPHPAFARIKSARK